MKTLIVYATKYGGTRLCAERIAKKLPGETTLYSIGEGETPALSGFDGVIFGTSVYMGQPLKAAKRFLKAHGAELMQKRLGLFLCCVQDVNKSVADQVEVAFPRKMREHACVIGALGGVVNFDKLRGFDKFLMGLISGDLRRKANTNVVSTLSDARIDQFAATYCKA